MGSWVGLWTKKIQKDRKIQLPLLKSHTKADKERGCPSSPKQASKGNYWLFSLPAARAGTPIKPFLNFLSGL